MAIPYRLVSRRNMKKDAPEGSMLLYAQTRSTRLIEFVPLCTLISKISTASSGDVKVVIDGLIEVLTMQLGYGDSVRLGDLGCFRMVAGSSGVETVEEFSVSLFRRGHIVFTPGPALREIAANASFERIKEEKSTTPDGGGGDGVVEV